MNSQKISVVIITYNEEKNIKDCLKTVLWADERIVIDSKSSDRTVKIANKYADKVFIKQWSGYSLQKNWGIKKARNDWILSLDADERITPTLRDEIIEVLKSNLDYAGFRIPRKNIYFGKFLRYGGNYPDYQLRLFNRKFGQFKIVEVHEGVECKARVGKLKNPMIHYTYDNLSDYFSKFNTYTQLESRILARKKTSTTISGIIRYLFLEPARKFIDRFILKLGFLDGYIGLLAIILTIITKIVSYLYYWERATSRTKN